MKRTSIYVLSSVILSLVGLVFLISLGDHPSWLSIATSLIAGGIASIAFAVIRFFDDREGQASARSTRKILREIRKLATLQNEQVDGLRRNLALTIGSDGRVFDRHPEDEVAELVRSVSGRLEIDALGLSLRPFMRDQFDRLKQHDELKLRLLVQHPGHPAFAMVCHQESRDLESMRAEAISVTRDALAESPNDEARSSIEVRWFTGLPTLTMTRISDVMYVRPRFMHEAHQGRVFYERYVKEDGAPFEIYNSHFTAAWDSAQIPTLDDCQAVEAAVEVQSI